MAEEVTEAPETAPPESAPPDSAPPETGPTDTGPSTTPVNLDEEDAAIQKIAEEVGGEDWLEGQAKKEYEGEEVGEGGKVEGEHVEGEEKEKERKKSESKVAGEELGEGEHEPEARGEHEPEAKAEQVPEEEEEEEEVEEEQPVDPTAPYDLTDSKEALKAPFELSPGQVEEAEQLWALYQDYTPAYTDIDNYVTPVELEYLLKCLLCQTHTPEQQQELIDYCVRPPHPDNHVNFEQFLKIYRIRQRDIPIEEELRLNLEVLDPDNTGLIDREYMREVLTDHGNKMNPKTVDNFVKEVDMANDGTIGIEDVVGTLCLDLNRDDIEMLQNTLHPPEERDEENIEKYTQDP